MARCSERLAAQKVKQTAPSIRRPVSHRAKRVTSIRFLCVAGCMSCLGGRCSVFSVHRRVYTVPYHLFIANWFLEISICVHWPSDINSERPLKSLLYRENGGLSTYRANKRRPRSSYSKGK
jgi:hypothetical protein